MAKNLFFIVAYNHEKFIESVVNRIPQELLSDPNNEVLIFDDASKDATFAKSHDLRAKLPPNGAKLTVLKNPVNQGYGGNQKLGYRYAIEHGYDRVFLVHGDGQYAPEFLPELIKRYEENPKAEAVFGTRMAEKKSALKGGMPYYKFAANIFLTWLQNKLLRSKMSEFHSGMRSYAISLLKRIPFECNSNDYHFDTEIIIQCLAAKSHPVEVPIPTHYGDEECNVNGVKYAKDILIASAHYRLFEAGFFYDPKFDLSKESQSHGADQDDISKKMLAEMSPNSRALLIGAQDPGFARALKERQVTCDTITLLETAHLSGPFRSFAPKGLEENIEAVKKSLRENEYRYILLPQTLEHFPNPETLLEIIRSNYQAGSQPQVIASTSNVGFFIVRLMHFCGQFNYGVGGVLDRNHARLFSSRAFKKLFRQYGYNLENYYGTPFPTEQIGRSLPWIRLLLLPFTGVLRLLAKVYPSMFAYKILLKASPLPSVSQLLADARSHSEELVREAELPFEQRPQL